MPTVKTTFSANPNLSSLRMRMISNPGIKARKITPRSCLKTGISRKMDRIVATISPIRVKKEPLLVKVLLNTFVDFYLKPTF